MYPLKCGWNQGSGSGVHLIKILKVRDVSLIRNILMAGSSLERESIELDRVVVSTETSTPISSSRDYKVLLSKVQSSTLQGWCVMNECILLDMVFFFADYH